MQHMCCISSWSSLFAKSTSLGVTSIQKNNQMDQEMKFWYLLITIEGSYKCVYIHILTWSRGYKSFFMHHSAELEIPTAHKNLNTDK